jgi:hypothetical protein
MTLAKPNNSNIILDYSSGLGEKQIIGSEYFSHDETAKELYSAYKKGKRCSYCGTKMGEVMTVHREVEFEDDRHITESVLGCKKCGWWVHERTDINLSDRFDESRFVAKLKKFEINDTKIPLTTLQQEILKRPNILYSIHHKKFEELVASVLKDFYKVEVKIIGKKDDGGIDLIFINGDNPYAIQVKRRETNKKVETVGLIREFLGALILKDFKRGKLITTASYFSKGSQKEKNKIIDKGLLQEFELIDFQQFINMFKFTTNSKVNFPWENIFAKELAEWLNIEDAEVSFKGFKNLNKKRRRDFYFLD